MARSYTSRYNEANYREKITIGSIFHDTTITCGFLHRYEVYLTNRLSALMIIIITV